MGRLLLALDIATVTGWAYGDVDAGRPASHGTIRFAPPSSPHGVVGLGAIKWLLNFRKVSPVSDLIYESTNVQFMAGRTNINTARILIGLPFLIDATALACEIPRVTEEKTDVVRRFFIGCNPKRDIAKQMVKAKCRDLGFDIKDDNDADAISLWLYQADLFKRRDAHGR